MQIQVFWVRLADYSILAFDDIILTTDARFSVSREGETTYQLVLQEAQEK